MLIALIVLMSLDYISGVMCAIVDRQLSSAIGFKGLCKKVLILMLVGVANIVDLHVVGTGSALRGAVICFYLSNEALSLFENAAHILLRSSIVAVVPRRSSHSRRNFSSASSFMPLFSQSITWPKHSHL